MPVKGWGQGLHQRDRTEEAARSVIAPCASRETSAFQLHVKVCFRVQDSWEDSWVYVGMASVVGF